jgi:hypothetical protein
MDWQFVVALVVAIPFVLLPAVVIWYINVGGIYKTFRLKIRHKAIVKKYSKIGK